MTMTEERPATGHFAAARRAMIDSQLRTSGVNEPWVLSAMMAVPREDFVPESARASAYIDRAIPLESGSQLAAPLVHAQMLAAAEPQTADNVLLVGDGNGYLAALLRRLAGSLDSVSPADLAAGRGKGTFSLIVVDGAAEQLPESTAGLLADNGRIVTGLAEYGITRLALGRKAGGQLALLPLADLGIPVLPELAAPQRWSF